MRKLFECQKCRTDKRFHADVSEENVTAVCPICGSTANQYILKSHLGFPVLAKRYGKTTVYHDEQGNPIDNGKYVKEV